jgi:hypothetical protein
MSNYAWIDNEQDEHDVSMPYQMQHFRNTTPHYKDYNDNSHMAAF